MDFFNWDLEKSEQALDNSGILGLGGDESVEDSFWNDYFTLNQFESPGIVTRQSSNSLFTSPDTLAKTLYMSQSDGSAADDSRRGSEAINYQGHPLSTGRDPLANRIIRRRTQNRNSQRIYRQRRVEERKRFEDRAFAAEETSEKLLTHVKELQSVVKTLKTMVEALEAENIALRNSTSSMPWRKPSTYD